MALLTDVAAPYSVGLASYFKEPFLAGGGTVVAEQKFSGGDKDFKAQLTAIKAANPDAIFVPGYYTEVGLIAQQARAAWASRCRCSAATAGKRRTLLQIGGAGAWKALIIPRTTPRKIPRRWCRNS